MRSKTPVETLLDKEVEWKPLSLERDPKDGTPFATHMGVLTMFGISMRCYRLSNGITVFNAEDFERFWGAM